MLRTQEVVQADDYKASLQLQVLLDDTGYEWFGERA